YEPKTVVTISFALFALQFITFWWALAGWLDDRLITILFNNMADQGLTSSVPFANFMSSTNDGWIMNLVLGMMYLVFPAFWMGMLS
ncbi:conjugal transfer protein TraG N-terminal domain-containing protein, partial [Staphylococcus sp. SIMBA_130]